MMMNGMHPSRAILISVFYASTELHVWVHGPVVAGDCADVCGPCYHQEPCVCPWSVLLPETCWCPWARLPLRLLPWTILVSVACVATEAVLMSLACASIDGLYYNQRPYWGPWHMLTLEITYMSPSLLWPETRYKFMIYVLADYKGQRSYVCIVSMTTDSQLKKRYKEGFCDNP